jgi:hypothetical protein
MILNEVVKVDFTSRDIKPVFNSVEIFIGFKLQIRNLPTIKFFQN